MAKVTFEFNEEDGISDIEVVAGRHKLLSALYDVRDFYCAIVNGKIYDPDVEIYVLPNDRVATKEDFENASKKGEILSGGKYYLSQDWVESRLSSILDEVQHLLD